MITVDKFTVTGGYEIYPYKDTRSAALFYGLGTLPAAPASSSIGAAKDNCIIVALQQNISDGVLSLHVVLGAPVSTSLGSGKLTITGLTSDALIVVVDDSGEFIKTTNTTAVGNWTWTANTDGGAIAPMNNMTNVMITVDSFSGALTTFRFVSSNGQYFDTPLSVGLQVGVTKSQTTIQSPLYLEPDPATYNIQQTVKLTMDSSYNSLIYTADGTTPTLAKYIAYDNLTPANPFIAVVQDGKGNAVFDGGFPKWYNNEANLSWSAFGQFSGSFKYFSNALNFIANQAKVAVGNKKVLFLGDANSGESYNIKDLVGTNPSAFRSTFNLVCSVMGYLPTYQTRSDYANAMLDPTYASLDQYCCIVIMSSVSASTQLITNAAVSNIIAYREAGNGIFLITDHGTGVNGFYKTANYVAANLGVTFTGEFNRTPMQVGFLRQTYGDHPLYANIPDTEYIPAGGSESKVVLTQQPTYTQATLPNLITKSQGISTFKFLLGKPDGTLTTTSVAYAINVVEPIKFTKQGTLITAVQPQFSHSFALTFALDHTSFGIGIPISGLIKVNSAVVGTFSGTTATPVYSFYTGGNTRSLNAGNNNIELEVQSPAQFVKTLTVPIINEPVLPLSMAQLTQKLNRADLASSSIQLKLLKQAPDILGIGTKISCASLVKGIRSYLA